MLPRERPPGADEQAFADFLREESERIARVAARSVIQGLPIAGTEARGRLRRLYRAQVEELARLLEAYGSDAPMLFGEVQRRTAALRVSQGMVLGEALEENARIHDAMLAVWEKRRGTIPGEIARLVLRTHAATDGQISDVYLTLQRSERAAFQEAALLQTIVSNLDEAILLFEANGTMSYATPAFERILGYPSQLFVGQRLERQPQLFANLNARDRYGRSIPLERFPHRRAIETGRPQSEEAVLMRRPDGSDAVLEIFAAPVFDEDESLRGTVLTFRDRTDRYHKAQALEAAYRELRQLHARLLSRTRMEAVGGLAASAAHRLNNELNVMVLRVKKLQSMPEAANEAEALYRSVRRIATLVASLQDLASAPEQRPPAPVDVNAVVRDAISLVHQELEAAGLEVRAEWGDLPLAQADRETLLEFFTALLLGERELLSGGRLRIETAVKEGQVRILLSDRSSALVPEQIESLFEPLSKGAAARTFSLSAGRMAIERWGGSVDIGAREGGGNYFEIRLRPVGEAAEVQAEQKEAAAAQASASQRVLVIDDDPDNADMLADLVAGAHADAATAGSGKEGIEKARSYQPDAALVDLLLPDMDGWEVVRALRQALPDLRIAVVSGLAVGEEERRVGLADQVFRKPVNSDDLLDFLGL